MDGFLDDGYNGGGSANFDGGSGSNDGTRNFLRGANLLLGSSVYEGFTDPAPPYTGSSGVNPPRWGLDSLDLNDGGGWAGMDGYDADLRSDAGGSQMGRLPSVFLGGGTSPTSSLPAPALEEAATAREAVPHQKLSEATACRASIVVAPLPQPSRVEEGAGVAAVAGLSHTWTTTS